MKAPFHTHESSAKSLGASPWTVSQRIALIVWEYSWMVFCVWTPKPANPWRLFVLGLFGATIEGRPFVHQRARIQIPWNLTLGDRACIGDRANLYTLDRIAVGEGALIAQEAYLCTGTHDLTSEALPLQTSPVVIGRRAFVGARAFVLPGVTIGERAIVGACSVVTKDVPPGVTVAGNPARVVAGNGA